MSFDPKHELKQTPGTTTCAACRNGINLGFDLTMAFQPIVDVARRSIFAYEALVRGSDGSSAGHVLSLVNEENRYAFDQSCRVKAIQLAAQLGIAEQGAKLSVNFMPGAVYSPAACIRRTLEAARENSFPLQAIIFEITETERVVDSGHLRRIADEYARHGFTLALDDFGAGYSGLNLLAELHGLQLVKLDGQLVRGLDRNPRSQRVVAATTALCRELGVEVLGECVETVAECEALQRCGVDLMQGYLFARPALEALPEVNWSALDARPHPSAHQPTFDLVPSFA
jgi:EAL domain-containing protein (putative c-di-GMP-specific phosphodiesterase class I)